MNKQRRRKALSAMLLVTALGFCLVPAQKTIVFAQGGSKQDLSPTSWQQHPDAFAGRMNTLPDDPEATYQGARVVHNVMVNGRKGMRIHANFTVKYGLDVPCRLIAYFYYDDEGPTPLKSADSKYSDRKGNVSASVSFKPAYDPAVYKDYQLFVPYSALNMESGDDYDLKFYLALYDNEGERFFGKSGWYKFHLTMP